jgi:hypothetical protein
MWFILDLEAPNIWQKNKPGEKPLPVKKDFYTIGF